VTLTIVAVIFGLFAIGLIVLLIYKSTLTMQRDDQLFLDDASSHMHDEQTELLTKVNRLTIPMRVFSIGSGVFLMALTAVWLYQKLNDAQ
jgi:hypothetical protein